MPNKLAKLIPLWQIWKAVRMTHQAQVLWYFVIQLILDVLLQGDDSNLQDPLMMDVLQVADLGNRGGPQRSRKITSPALYDTSSVPARMPDRAKRHNCNTDLS